MGVRSRSVLPSRPAAEGPLAHAIREALESVLSPAAAQHLLDSALRAGALERIPQEIGGFRAFCAGPFRRAVRATVAMAEAEQIFERVGYVLWMATGDVGMVEVARSWSESAPDGDDEDSGVHNVESVGPAISQVRGAARADRPGAGRPSGVATSAASPAASATAPSATTPSELIEPGPKQSGTRAHVRRTTPSASFGTAATLGRMPAISKPMPVVRSSVEIPAQGPDARSEPHELPARLPSAVLLVSLDPTLVTQIRAGMDAIPVRAVHAASELVSSLLACGDSLVVLVDTALPSIAVPTFAGLIPVLPEGTRVVLWGASARHHARLVAIYPETATWIACDGTDDAVGLLRSLP